MPDLGIGYKDSYLKPSNPILNNNADLEIKIIIANHIKNWLLCHLLTGYPLLVCVYVFGSDTQCWCPLHSAQYCNDILTGF